ncbi:MAG: Na/Pi cotransporter family protein [Candidatus Omnitrophota bacterium]
MIKEIVFGVIGGLGLLIYGIWEMSEGLHKVCGNRMRKVLSGLTNSPLRGVVVGTAVTSLVQSSSATTVMVVGFVNAGLMTLDQSLGIILGANIGTTVTAQLIAFKLTDYALPIIGLGTLTRLLAKKKSYQHIGEFLLGFGILFLGLNILTRTVKPLGQFQIFNDVLIMLSHNRALAVFAGMAITAIFQSSSVTTGMILGLAIADLINLDAAIPLILGCNIGTCVTVMLASIGTSISSRRAAVAHLMFNVIGVVVFFPFIGIFQDFIVRLSGNLARQVAYAHTFFNIINMLIFLPFLKPFSRFLTRFIQGVDEEDEYHPKFLERRLLNTPPIAIDAATKEIISTLGLTRRMVSLSMESFFHNDSKDLARVERCEEAVDLLRTEITSYFIEMMQHELDDQESRKIPALIHVINDVERVGDHAENLKELSEQKIDQNMHFSNSAITELQGMYQAIDQMIDSSVNALRTNDTEKAKLVLEQENRINLSRDSLKENHVNRLAKGHCNVISGVVFLDVISNLEKIGDHLANIAYKVIDSLQWDTKENDKEVEEAVV